MGSQYPAFTVIPPDHTMSASPAKTALVEMSPSKKQARIEKAQELLTSGKRNLLVSDYPSAVSDLAEACSLVAKIHGETSEECGEVYLSYGKALLEVSRQESGVLGQALMGVDLDQEERMDESRVEDPEKLSKDERLEVEEQVAEALDENYEKHDQVAKLHNAEESEDSDMEESSTETEDEDLHEPKKSDLESDAAKKTEENEEEPGDLQMAWEVLELAKNAFSKIVEVSIGDKKDADLRLAEAHLMLGEVGLEHEDYYQAVEDFATSLKIRESALPSDSRSISEVLYQLGLAQALAAKYKEAEASLDNAIKVLQRRIENLKKMGESENIVKEIKDMEALVDEIKEKIEDHKNMEKGIYVEKTSGFPGKSDGQVISSIPIKSAKPSGTTTVGTA